MQEKHIKESIAEMSEEEVRKSCSEFAENISILLDSAGVEIGSDKTVHEIANIFKLQGIEQLIDFLTQMKETNEKFTIQSLIETIHGYAKFADLDQSTSPHSLH